MKTELPDKEEQDNSKALFEQCWLGPLLLAFWALVIVAVFFVCSAKGAECKIEWNAPAPADQVTSWKVYRGLDLLGTVTVPAATLDLPRDTRSTLSVVAVNAAGSSPPALITVIPWTPKTSEDLRVWIAHPSKCLFTDASKPRMFSSYAFPPP